VLQSLEIENYQSLKRLKLALGQFTVITGPTGSGKSAVIRALRMLAFNAKGTGYITRGEKTCKVMAVTDDGLGVAIVRGGRGQDAYVLDVLGEQKRFTKLGGQVPEQVTECLQVGELNLAGQFDSPYLLGSSAGEVARTLGKLTNVTLVFGAAREAGRRKQRIADRLKDRQADLERLREQAQTFAGLGHRRQAVRAAEEALERAQALQVRAQRLRSLMASLAAAQAVLGQAAAAVPQVPSLERAEQAVARAARLRALLDQQAQAVSAQQQAILAVSEAAGSAAGLDLDYKALLKQAGRCPVCGQPVS
jgi:DNA repair protein SbcC/Rad50